MYFSKLNRFTIHLQVIFIIFAMSFANIALARCDFNNDGYDDIAVGIRADDIGILPYGHGGSVQVLYGRSSGLSVTNNQLWNLESQNVLGEGADSFIFGYAVACGDFNGDALDDLAVGAGTTVQGNKGAGSVTILYGSSRWRLSATGNQFWTQDSPGIPDIAEPWDLFGRVLAAGDFNNDGYDDLAITVLENLQGWEGYGPGAVHILYGSSAGLTSAGTQMWDQDTPGIEGIVEPDDDFGAALTTGDFGKNTNSCYDDLAIGVAGESPGGAVLLLYGSSTGLTSSESELWTANSPGVPGASAMGDNFGSALAAGPLRRTVSGCAGKTLSDLAIGAQRKTINDKDEAGAVFVLYGTNVGLSANDSQMWTQNTYGITETAQAADLFGSSLAVGSKNNDASFLVIGVRQESIHLVFGGAVHILYTDPSTGLLAAAGSKYYNQSTPGIHGIPESADNFGNAVATGDFNADGVDDVAIGVQFENLGSKHSAGAIHILYSAGTAKESFFHQDSIDMKGIAESSEYFGTCLSK